MSLHAGDLDFGPYESAVFWWWEGHPQVLDLGVRPLGAAYEARICGFYVFWFYWYVPR